MTGIQADAEPTEKDPVCGMSVDPASANHSYAYEDSTYYFCCAGCQEKFKTDPEKYIKEI